MDARDRRIIETALRGFVIALGSAGSDVAADLPAAIASAIDRATAEDSEHRQRFDGGGGPGTMSMMVVRNERRIVKSLRWQNIQLDGTAAASGAASAGSAMMALTSGGANPVVVPTSLLLTAAGLAFTVLRMFEKTVRWEDACLLHALGKRANYHGVVPKAEAHALGPVLVAEYDYKKGNNSNEVDDILDRLTAWRALERVTAGYKVMESVKFWRGRWISDDPW